MVTTHNDLLLKILWIVENWSHQVEVYVPTPLGVAYPEGPNRCAAIVNVPFFSSPDPRLVTSQAVRDRYQMNEWAARFDGVCTFHGGRGDRSNITFHFRTEPQAKDFAQDVQDAHPDWFVETKRSLLQTGTV